jgi:hypothetical protein
VIRTGLEGILGMQSDYNIFIRFVVVCRCPSIFLISTFIACKVNEVAEWAFLEVVIVFGIDYRGNHIEWITLIIVFQRRRRFMVIREWVGSSRFELGNVENRVDA